MSTLKHMREPWKIKANFADSILITGPEEALDPWIAQVISTNRKANAERIVACVNACEGMEDPAAEIAALKAQRNELLAALEELMAMPGEQLGRIRASYNIARNYPVKPEVAEQAAKFALFVNLVAEVKGGKS